MSDVNAARSAALDELEAALDRWRPGWEEDREVVERAQKISAHYTDPARSRQTPAADALTRVAYLAYFGPRAIGAVDAVVRPMLGGQPCPPVVEIGAGTGASSLALAALGAPKLTLIDRDPAALDAANALVGGRVKDVETQLRSKLADVVVAEGALVVLSFALAEIVDAVTDGKSDGPAPDDDAIARERALFDDLAALAAKSAGLVIVDAGDRIGGRVVQRFREHVLDKGLSVTAPCPHDDPCPALARRRDWCHTRIARELPERFARVADAIGRDGEVLSFSYLVVRPEAANAPPVPTGLRVLGEARKEKGRVRLPVCGPGGVRYVQALKRDKAVYRALLNVERGTLLRTPEGDEARGETLHIRRLLEAHDDQRFP